MSNFTHKKINKKKQKKGDEKDGKALYKLMNDAVYGKTMKTQGKEMM